MRNRKLTENGDSPRPQLVIYVSGTARDITQEIEIPVYTYGFVKPHAYPYWETILADIENLSRRRTNPLSVLYEREDRFERSRAEQHYRVHRGRPFFSDLITMITEGPIRQFVLTGNNAIQEFREIIGATDPAHASRNTIRGMCHAGRYGRRRPTPAFNAVHASDSMASFLEEVYLHFRRDEIGPEFWQRADNYSGYLQALGEFRPRWPGETD